MALLYVLLNTFGALTHTHEPFSSETPDATYAARPDHGVRRMVASTKRTLPLPDHCAYCNWQANSVSAALPIRHLETPAVGVPLLFTPCVLTPAPAQSRRASSRAPPLA